MTSIGHNGAGADPDAPVTYRDSGVDIDAGNALVAAIKPLVKATRRPGAEADLGGFGACGGLGQFAANDGTKLKIAIETGQHSTIGVDLVRCASTTCVQGAEPLFFSTHCSGKLDVQVAREVIAGIAAGRHEGWLRAYRWRDWPRCRACTAAAITTSLVSPWGRSAWACLPRSDVGLATC